MTVEAEQTHQRHRSPRRRVGGRRPRPDRPGPRAQRATWVWPRHWPWPVTTAPSPPSATWAPGAPSRRPWPCSTRPPWSPGTEPSASTSGRAPRPRPTGPASSTGFRALGSPEEACKHIAPLVGHFDATCDAVALEVAADHALIQVDPSSGREPARPPVRDDPGPAVAGARPLRPGPRPDHRDRVQCPGWPLCLYALSWDDPSTEAAVPPTRRRSRRHPGRRRRRAGRSRASGRRWPVGDWHVWSTRSLPGAEPEPSAGRRTGRRPSSGPSSTG